MFNDTLVKALQSQIEYLQVEVRRKDTELKDMQDRFMAMVGDAFYKYQSKELMNKPVPAPSYVDQMGNVVRMETEEEAAEKEKARKEVFQILGH